MCDLAKSNGLRTPKFACNLPASSLSRLADVLATTPYEYISIEAALLSDANVIPFGADHIVFTQIMRHPVDRFLAGDGIIQGQYPEVKHGNWTRAMNSKFAGRHE